MTEPSKALPDGLAEMLHDNARLAIPLGIAVVMGVFVSLGIEGDLLARLLRQHPYWVGFALAGAVSAVTAPLILAAMPKKQLGRVTVFSAFLLVASTWVAVWAGIDSTTIRELPSLDVSGVAADREKQSVTITVSASALSMASADSMLLKIATFSPNTSAGDALEACKTWRPWTLDGSQILHWGETGPTAAGAAETAYTFVVDTNSTRFVCAQARLSYKRNEQMGRRTLALFDARAAATGPTNN